MLLFVATNVVFQDLKAAICLHEQRDVRTTARVSGAHRYVYCVRRRVSALSAYSPTGGPCRGWLQSSSSIPTDRSLESTRFALQRAPDARQLGGVVQPLQQRLIDLLRMRHLEPVPYTSPLSRFT